MDEKFKNKATTYKLSIQSLETVCKINKVKVDIFFRPPMNYIPEPGWRIKTMGKLFKNDNIIELLGEVVTFIYEAHNDHPMPK